MCCAVVTFTVIDYTDLQPFRHSYASASRYRSALFSVHMQHQECFFLLLLLARQFIVQHIVVDDPPNGLEWKNEIEQVRNIVAAVEKQNKQLRL